MKSLIGTDMADYFALSVPFRTESTCILGYILILEVLIGIMLCLYSLFSLPS